ncbi:hypothetical protein ASG11_17880 [Sphingomonas sp. Leaf357]|uniref:hypothetical protein n=1 Tax=Sphingomonas sp. Leaf357 TaxID=1736350 RepID=UPI0006F5F86D|nr:hypothetical protein [Sphingomonas sp. Leaf357]KQS01523.1 hypothetical protein ASG11_17880 [Sphingomonas sp. Leaf357]
MRLSHSRARQIVQRLAVDQSDIRVDQDRHADDLAALLRYIDEQEAADAMDSATAGRVAHAAERRSHEAIMRVATLTDDQRELRDMIGALAAMIIEAGDDRSSLPPA